MAAHAIPIEDPLTIAGRAFAAANQSRAILAPDVQIIEYGFELALVHAGPHLSFRIAAVANPH